MTDDVRYHGPRRDPNAVIDAMRADDDFMRQLQKSIDEAQRGLPGTPLRQLREEEARARRLA